MPDSFAKIIVTMYGIDKIVALYPLSEAGVQEIMTGILAELSGSNLPKPAEIQEWTIQRIWKYMTLATKQDLFTALWGDKGVTALAMSTGWAKTLDEAQEINSQVGLQVWRKLHNYNPTKGPWKTWVSTQSYGVFLTAKRRERQGGRPTFVFVDDMATVATYEMDVDDQDNIEGVIEVNHDDQRRTKQQDSPV